MALRVATILANSLARASRKTIDEELAACCDANFYTRRHDVESAGPDALRALSVELRELLTSSRDQAVEIVNRMLSEEGALPRLVRHDTFDWHLRAVPPDAPWSARIRVESAMAMIDVIRADEMSRLGICVDPDCDGVVLDLSRNRSRRFCSTACGNRRAVAGYRARQRSGLLHG